MWANLEPVELCKGRWRRVLFTLLVCYLVSQEFWLIPDFVLGFANESVTQVKRTWQYINTLFHILHCGSIQWHYAIYSMHSPHSGYCDGVGHKISPLTPFALNITFKSSTPSLQHACPPFRFNWGPHKNFILLKNLLQPTRIVT